MLNVHHFGAADGPPLLLLHGVTGHGRRWVQVAEALAGRRILAPDLRGHGASPWVPPWSVEQHVADVLEVLDAEGVAETAVVGHSMGGLIGTHLAATAPDRVTSLVLLDPVLGLDPEDALGAAEGIRLDTGWASEEEARADRRAGHPESSFAAIDRDLADAGGVDNDGRFRLRYCRSAAIAGWAEMAKAPPDLSSHAVPTLDVIADVEGGYDPEPLLRVLRAAPAQVTVERLPVGHMLYWDAFDETVELIRGFTL